METAKQEAIVIFTQAGTVRQGICELPTFPTEEDIQAVVAGVESTLPGADVRSIIECPSDMKASDFKYTDLFVPGHLFVVHVFDQ